MTTAEFIQSNRTADVHQLALAASRYAGIDMPYALTQIDAWQRARTKLPLWAATEGIVFPQSLPMEQCSSQVAAEYKARVWQGLPHSQEPETTMTDLTAGFGVDATMLGRCFSQLTLVEQNTELCSLARNNLPLLGIKAANIINTTCEEAIHTLPHQNLIFIDPARRDSNGRKTVLLSDCSPDITMLQDTLLERADYVMAKLSPMLDVTSVVRSLSHIIAIHIVSVGGECKEIIAVMSRKYESEPMLYCVNLPAATDGWHSTTDCQHSTTDSQSSLTTDENTDIFSLPLAELSGRESSLSATTTHLSDHLSFLPNHDNASDSPVCYLYEPNASVMKAGVFAQIAIRYDIHQLHPNSHLYVSDTYIDRFPGRKFILSDICSLGKTDQKRLQQLGKANIAVRNFPLSVAQLRQRLHLSDGGSTYIFATTLAPDNKKVLLICRKPH